MTSLTLDNIFKAVTDDCVESYELQLRSDLLIVLRDVMYDRGWQQKEAAEHMRLTQQGILNIKAWACVGPTPTDPDQTVTLISMTG